MKKLRFGRKINFQKFHDIACENLVVREGLCACHPYVRKRNIKFPNN